MRNKTINIPEELHTLLKVLASEEKMKLRELVELIIKEYVSCK